MYTSRLPGRFFLNGSDHTLFLSTSLVSTTTNGNAPHYYEATEIDSVDGSMMELRLRGDERLVISGSFLRSNAVCTVLPPSFAFSHMLVTPAMGTSDTAFLLTPL
jgi:hypothetical protein